MEFEQIDVTGCRVTGAMTIAGGLGPKHHGVVLGLNTIDGLVYIAELLSTGYQISTFEDFEARYWKNGKITVEPVEDQNTGLENAKRALREITTNAKSKYNLITNNCESFVNRATSNSSVSMQVTTAIGILVLISTVWILKKKR